MLRRLLHRLKRSKIRKAFLDRAQRRRDAEEIAASGLFDRDYYLNENPDVAAANLDAIDHYLRVGGEQGRNPSPLFDRAWYLAQYPDVRSAGLDPLLHYLRHGGFEGRDPTPLFDGDWYLTENPDVAAARINPLVHYLRQGAAAGLAPNRLFKGRWYLVQHPEAGKAGMTPLAHYLANAAKGADPNPWFDSRWYLRTNRDVAARRLNPLAHYLREGAAQGRPPSPLFKGEWYLEHMPDLAPMGALPVQADAKASDAGVSIDGSHANAVALSVSGTDVAHALTEAIISARADRRHLLVMLCDAKIAAAQVDELVEALNADPLIGYVVPRFEDASGRILPLPSAPEQGALPAHDRAVLDDLPAYQIAPEFLAGCVLIRADLVANFPDLAAEFETVAGVLRGLMAWGRRLGFRALIANRVLLPIAAPRPRHLTLDAGEQEKLIRLFPDAALADARFRALACHYREALLARAREPDASERRRLLFDCSGMSAVHNGTNECALGILDGVASRPSDWSVTVLAPAEAIAFHGLRERYERFTIVEELTGTYTVAVRLSQPWSMHSIAQLHRHALRIAFLMLDTIAWDIVYAAGPEVEPTWALMAAHADAILHISEFTKDRFNFRFPGAPHVRQAVTHLSCHYDEYVTPHEQPSAGHILLIGNDLEHKGLVAALELLPRAFPRQKFVVIGQDNLRQRNVTSIRSGQVSAAEMERLFAGARMLVFPSFYEGFGFPVVKGLGYGLDVVARRSDLLREIGSLCAPRGHLVPFDDASSLIEVIGKVLGGEDVTTVPLGTALAGAEPPRWRDVAACVLDLVDELAADTSVAAHDAREAALRFALAGAP